jgi:gas vesicle structural protein
MTSHDPTLVEQVTLLELVDRVVNKGVVLTGDITLSVAGVDLIYVGLRVLLSSVDTLDRLEREQLGELLAGVEP